MSHGHKERDWAGADARGELFVDREELIAEFVRRVNVDPPQADILFLHGEGGIGKTALLQELERRYCRRLKPARGEVFPPFLKMSQTSPAGVVESFGRYPFVPVPTSRIDFSEDTHEGRYVNALAALKSIRHQLHVPAPLFQAASLMYFKSKGPLTRDAVESLFPGAGAELAAALTDQFKVGNTLAAALGLLADGTLKTADIAVGAIAKGLWDLAASKWAPASAEWFARRRITSSGVRDLLSRPAAELFKALPRVLAEDLNAHMVSPGKNAPKRLVLLFDSYSSFIGSERHVSSAERLARDAWFRDFLSALQLGEGIVAVVAGDDAPFWPASLRVTSRPVGYLPTRDAAVYLTKAGITSPWMREHLCRHAEVTAGHVQPFYLSLLEVAHRLAFAAGFELDLGADDATSPTGQQEQVINRLLATAGAELADALKALAACRSFDRALFMSLGDSLRFNPTDHMWRTVTSLSCVERIDRSLFRMHGLLRRFLGGTRAAEETHAACDAYFRQDPSRIADAIYHESFLSPSTVHGSWDRHFAACVNEGLHDRCASLLDVRDELMRGDLSWAPLGLAAGNYLVSIGRYDDAELAFGLVREYARVCLGVVPLRDDMTSRELIAALQFVGSRTPANRAAAHSLGGNALDRLGDLRGRQARLDGAEAFLREAIEEYDAALAIEPASGAVLVSKSATLGNLGSVLAMAGNRQPAEQCYRSALATAGQALSLGAADATAWANIGGTFRNWADLQRILAGYESTAAFFQMSVAAYDKAIDIDPRYVSARIHRAHAYRMWARLDHQWGNADAAAEHARMAVTYSEVGLTGIPPSAAAYSAYADALSTLAGIEFESGRSGEADARFEAAFHAYRQALAMAPDSIDCRLGLSTALVGHGKLHAGGRDRVTAEASYREAITRYDEALAITAPSALVEHGRGLAHFNLAALLAWHREYDAAEQSLSEALRAFDRTMALAPLHWEASNNRGYALRAIALLRVEGGRAVGDALLQSMSAFVNGWQLCPNADSLHGMSANRLTVCRAAPLADGCRSLAEIVAILPTWKERFPWDRRAAEIEGEVATARRELRCADPE